jgi:CPA1 family monovalent cation:H+ antiporter
MYLAAEQFHFSGVMAVVSGGLFLSFRSHEIFRHGATRINMLGVWTTLIFVLNALVFILIGLELPEIIEGLGNYSLAQAIEYGLIISAIVIAIRFLWVFPAAHLMRLISPKARKDPSPGWKSPLIVSWAGMRGVVSLATALSIPFLMDDKITAFPLRNLILFITFTVIFVTLVFQGLTLPYIVKLIKIDENLDPETPAAEQQAGIRLKLNQAALKQLRRHYQQDITDNELVGFYRDNLQQDINNTRLQLDALECDAMQLAEIDRYHHILRDIYGVQRQELYRLRQENLFSDEEIRKMEVQLDLDELKISPGGH